MMISNIIHWNIQINKSCQSTEVMTNPRLRGTVQNHLLNSVVYGSTIDPVGVFNKADFLPCLLVFACGIRDEDLRKPIIILWFWFPLCSPLSSPSFCQSLSNPLSKDDNPGNKMREVWCKGSAKRRTRIWFLSVRLSQSHSLLGPTKSFFPNTPHLHQTRPNNVQTQE